MCGRFVSASPPDEVARYFGAEVGESLVEPSTPPESNFNVAPTTDVMAVIDDGGRRVEAFHWGLVPRWAKDPSIGNRMINARSETIAEKNAFKSAFKRRRCILTADGFYEWTPVPGHKKKQPWFISRPDGEPYAFAGLWETWRREDEDGSFEELRSCTILTGSPNEAMSAIHHRMPVMLAPSSWDTWLDPTNDDLDALATLFTPAPSELISIRPVSTDVGNVRNKGAYLLDPIETLDPDGTGEGTDPDELLAARAEQVLAADADS